MTNYAENPTQLNRYGSQQATDRAIIVMALLRATKRPDQKGVGGNREDWPIFKEIADTMCAGKTVEKELMFQARHRVQKYQRQISDSLYRDRVFNGSINTVLQAYANVTKQPLMLHDKIVQVLTEKGYGDW